MADENNTVVKTIENVDRMFSQIVVNGEVHNSENYTPPVTLGQRSVSSSPARSIQGEDIHGVELNDVLHNFVDNAVAQALADESAERQYADNTLQGDIDSINALIPASASTSNKLVDSNTLGVVQASVSDIEALIPAQATTSNKLADKDFVNSSIATNTANFLGTYTSLADIEAIQNPTNNDYAFLQTTDSAGNNVFDRYKYNASQDEWLFEYELNNSSFTAEQWATINSGLTSSSVSDAINALDVAQVGGATKYIESISQVDGKIVAVEKTFAVALLDIAHPVGSLYWTSSSENPAVTFGGGTWVQIKDVFVWAKGDSDTINDTGGSKTVTLTTNQIPSHTHSVTASGTISVTTNPTFTGSEHSHTYTPAGSVSVTTNPTFSGSEHSHTYTPAGSVSVTTNPTFTGSSHTHSYTPAGSVSVTTNPTFSGSAVNTGAMSGNSTGSFTIRQNNYGQILSASGNMSLGTGTNSNNITNIVSGVTAKDQVVSLSIAHTHSVTASGTISGGAYKFTGTATSLSATQGGSISGGAYKFTGTQATLKATAGGSISGGAYSFTGSAVTSGGAGGGLAHDNMPPYVVKYCWERTA